jgi:hypothetical protein
VYSFNYIILSPKVKLFLGTVASGIGRVNAPSCGILSYQAKQPFVFLIISILSSHCVNNGKRIIPVNTLGVHLVGLTPRRRAQGFYYPLSRRMSARPFRRSFEDVEDYRQSSLVSLPPQLWCTGSMAALLRASHTGPQPRDPSPMLETTIPPF